MRIIPMLKQIHRPLLIAALGCVVLLVGIRVAWVEAEPQAEAGTARAAYVENGCYQCHGYDGQGGFAGPRLAPGPLPLEAFVSLVRYPSNLMPAYSMAMLSDEQLALIHRYLQTVPAPADGEEGLACFD